MPVISDKFFMVLGLMMLPPVVFTVLVSTNIVDPTTATIGTMGINLGMLFWIRKTLNGSIGNILGGSKVKFQCLTCHGTKFDPKGTCYRCGGKSKKSI